MFTAYVVWEICWWNSVIVIVHSQETEFSQGKVRLNKTIPTSSFNLNLEGLKWRKIQRGVHSTKQENEGRD